MNSKKDVKENNPVVDIQSNRVLRIFNFKSSSFRSHPFGPTLGLEYLRYSYYLIFSHFKWCFDLTPQFFIYERCFICNFIETDNDKLYNINTGELLDIVRFCTVPSRVKDYDLSLPSFLGHILYCHLYHIDKFVQHAFFLVPSCNYLIFLLGSGIHAV